jgi:hypothetical protein
MINYRADRAVSGAVEVWWAVWGAIDNRDVRDVVYDDLGQAVYRTVQGSWHGDVYWALQQYHDPPGLQDFLQELKLETGT